MARHVRLLLTVALAASLCTGFVGFTGGSVGAISPFQPGQLVPVPANAITTQGAIVRAVSCPTEDVCVAFGAYIDGNGDNQLFVTTSTNGAWGRSFELPLPTAYTTGPVGLTQAAGLSCPAVGTCLAVGYVGSGVSFAFLETGGSWQMNPLTIPAASGDVAQVEGISCASATWCAAVGTDSGSSSSNGFYETWTGGQWSAPSLIGSPLHQSLQYDLLNAISCWSSADCEAVGSYFDTSLGQHQDMAVSIFAGVAQAKNLPTSYPSNELTAVSCWTLNRCLAGGDSGEINQTNATFASLGGQGWSNPTLLSLPSNAVGSATGASKVGGIACPLANECLLAGYFLDSENDFQGFTQDGVLGSSFDSQRAPSTLAAPPSNPNPTGNEWGLYAVSCGNGYSCMVAGTYRDGNGTTNALSVQTALAPGGVVGLRASKIGATSVTLQWSAPLATGAGHLTYGVSEGMTSTKRRFVRSAATTTVVVGSLHPKATYYFSVSAVASDGQASTVASVRVRTR